MGYLDVFGVLTGVGVDVSKIFGVGAGVLKCGARVESESDKSLTNQFRWSRSLHQFQPNLPTKK